MDENVEVVSTEIKIPEYTDEQSELDALGKEGDQSFIKAPAVGEETEVIVCKSYQQKKARVVNPKDKPSFTIELTTNKQGVGYYYALIDEQNRELAVSTWVLHSELRDLFQEQKKINGLKIKIYHPKKGEYKVEVIE